jgi:large subunit ribosomal protein L25
MDKAIRISVPVVHTGEPVGVKAEGGFVDFVTREVEIECLPSDIPEHLPIDISGLHLHQSFKVEQLALPAGIKVLDDPGTVLVLIGVPHVEKEAAPEEKVEEAAVEEKEPEVIKKERAKETEEKE